jgi:ribonuclease VapC
VIVDTSALIAIIRGEPEAAKFMECIEHEAELRISAASYLEAAIVLDGTDDPVVSARLDTFLTEYEVGIEPVTGAQARIAREAYRGFGKGRKHPANLNFGDCFAYALAKAMREPLLFKGNDFRHTDVDAAIP